MKPGAGKQKGNEFERLICRMLTEWITGKQKPEIFWRSASSGAKATQDAKSGNKSKMGGDIVSVSNEGAWFTNAFSIECKFYKEFKIESLLEGKGIIKDWWAQCCGDAYREKKCPFLVFKKNRSPIYLAYEIPEVMRTFALGMRSPFIEFRNVKIHNDSLYSNGFDICLFEDWLKYISPCNLKMSIEVG